MKNKFLISTIVVLAFFVLLGMRISQGAAELTLRYSPPCLLEGAEGFGSCNDTTNVFASYIKRIYQFGLGIAGVLAVGMIVAGAIRRVVSAGNPSGITESNSMITSALWGLALLFGSYLILRTINPVLVSLRDPSAPQVTSVNPFAYQQDASSTCPVPSHASCFFDPVKMAAGATSTAYCDIEKILPCTAIYSNDDGCANPTNRGSIRGIPYPSTPCVCENCVSLANKTSQKLPVPIGKCNFKFNAAEGPGTGYYEDCFLEENTFRAALSFFADLTQENIRKGTDTGDWRIGVVFPPRSNHLTSGHYTGTVFDMGIEGGLPNPMTNDKCEEIIKVAGIASRWFEKILIEGPGMGICANEFSQTDGSVVTVPSTILPRSGPGRIIRLLINDFHLHVEK